MYHTIQAGIRDSLVESRVDNGVGLPNSFTTERTVPVGMLREEHGGIFYTAFYVTIPLWITRIMSIS